LFGASTFGAVRGEASNDAFGVHRYNSITNDSTTNDSLSRTSAPIRDRDERAPHDVAYRSTYSDRTFHRFLTSQKFVLTNFSCYALCFTCYARSEEQEMGIETKDSNWFTLLCVMHYAKIYTSAFMQTMVDRFLDCVDRCASSNLEISLVFETTRYVRYRLAAFRKSSLVSALH